MEHFTRPPILQNTPSNARRLPYVLLSYFHFRDTYVSLLSNISRSTFYKFVTSSGIL